jgi:hypothetical protein
MANWSDVINVTASRIRLQLVACAELSAVCHGPHAVCQWTSHLKTNSGTSWRASGALRQCECRAFLAALPSGCSLEVLKNACREIGHAPSVRSTGVPGGPPRKREKSFVEVPRGSPLQKGSNPDLPLRSSCRLPQTWEVERKIRKSPHRLALKSALRIQTIKKKNVFIFPRSRRRVKERKQTGANWKWRF